MSKTLDQHMGWDKPDYGLIPWVPDKKIIPPGGVDPTLCYGIELEIEGLEEEEEDRRTRCVPGMGFHEDGSLRNNGGEFVTKPMQFGILEYVLDQFFHKNKLNEENYSERCSVHVHVNCRDLTLSQIRLILCLYQITERILFNFIKADRKNNIFCVPWSESVLGQKALQSEDQLLKMIKGSAWQKYSALNLLPLRSQGTIEFRHMEGTKDLNYILTWCNIIGSFFKYARTHKYEEVIDSLMKLNTTSAYATFMQEIFHGELYDALVKPDFRELLEEGVLNMKYMLVEDIKLSNKLVAEPAQQEEIWHEQAWQANNPWAGQLQIYINMGVQPDPVSENARQGIINNLISQGNDWEQMNQPVIYDDIIQTAPGEVNVFDWNFNPEPIRQPAVARNQWPEAEAALQQVRVEANNPIQNIWDDILRNRAQENRIAPQRPIAPRRPINRNR